METKEDQIINIGPFRLRLTEKSKYGERAKVEMIRLSIALAVAVLGLIVGAREHLLNLDIFAGLVGVFLVGFGADTIKNLVTKK